MSDPAGAQQDHYQILGVDRNVSRDDIEKAYFDLARRLHPDVAGGGAEATARFMLINEAFQILNSVTARREYDLTLGEPVQRTESPAARDSGGQVAVRAEEPRAGSAQRLDERIKRIIRQADKLCDQGNFWQASDLLQRMIPQYPRQPALRRALGRAASGKLRHREAADHLKIACEVEYFNSDNHVLLGEAYMKGTQWQKARDALMDALSWNEENERAKKGLVEVQKHLGNDQSFLKKLFRRLTMPIEGEKDGKHGAKRK